MLVDKMVAKTNTWSTRNLSFAGSAQLVNSVLMSIHSYSGQIFSLPSTILSQINNICKSFLWNGKASDVKGGYVNWSQVCMPKK